MNQIPLTKFNKVKKLAGIDSEDMNFLKSSNKYAKGLILNSKNGFQYRIKNGAVKIQQHIKGNPNYISTKSYFNTNNLDEVINIHKEVMDKVPLNDWIALDGIGGIIGIYDMGRIIGTKVNIDGTIGGNTTKVRIVRSLDSIHAFPDL